MAVIEQDLVRQAPAPILMPMVDVSADAANRLSGMMREKELSGYALRVFVSGGGCSGLQYGMTFDDELREGDADFEQPQRGFELRLRPLVPRGGGRRRRERRRRLRLLRQPLDPGERRKGKGQRIPSFALSFCPLP
jgi:hypothetical protein